MREHRIFGPPGTGKTTRLVTEIAAAAQRFAGAVAVASFTRAAATELRTRGVAIDDRRVGTLHSLALRSLGDVGTILDGDGPGAQGKAARALRATWHAESRSAWAISARDASPDQRDDDDDTVVVSQPARSASAAPGSLWRDYGYLRGRLVPVEAWPDDVREMHDAFVAFCREHHATDFTGIVERALRERVPLPFPVQVLFADEAQDCTPLELALLRQWGETCAHWVIAGDDQQAIYGFRGATPEAFLDPPLPAEQKTFLRRSWRLSAEVHRYAVAYGETMSRFERKVFEPNAPGGAVMIGETSAHQHAYIASLAADHARARESVMVLASCAYMLTRVIGALRTQGTPFANPYRVTRGDWNPLRGACARLASFCAMMGGDATWRDVAAWVDVVDVKAAKWARGVKAEAIAMAADSPDEPVEALDFERVFGHAIPRSVQWLVDRLLGSSAASFEFALSVLEQHGSEALSAEPRVTVGTIHSVKGGEADVVLLIPDISQASWLAAHATPNGMDEIKRLMYVGMTRARSVLHVLRPATSMHDPDLFEAGHG